MRRNASVQSRLFGCLGLILLAAIGNSTYALFSVRNMRRELTSEVLRNGTMLDDADEVRNLAQRSAQAAKDTSELIEESIAKSNSAGLKVDQVAENIRAITADAAESKVLAEEVRLGSEQQLVGMEEISKAIAQMEQLTQTTAAHAEEGAASSEQLRAQPGSLNEIAARLSGMVGVH